MNRSVPAHGGGTPSVSVRPVKGHDGTSVIVSLDATVPTERLREEILRVLGQTPDRWRHGTARLDLGARDLALFDVRRLVHLLRDTFSLSVTGVYTSERAIHKYVSRELKLQVFVRDPSDDWSDEELACIGDETDPTRPGGLVDVVVLDDVGDEDVTEGGDTVATEVNRASTPEDGDTLIVIDPSAEDAAILAPGPGIDPTDPPPTLHVEPPPVSFAGGRRAMTVARTLRGGQSISFPGDVIIFGDVNPGAKVEAGGHILVLGSMRGLAHAGQHGAVGCVIVAFDLRPTQLRIGSQIAFLPQDGRGGGARNQGFKPEIAWVDHDGAIHIGDYAGRLPGPPPDSEPAASAANQGSPT